MIKKRKNFKLIKQKRKKRGLLGYNKKIPLHLLHINITKSNLKVSVSKAVNGNIVFKKSEGGVQEIKRGSINSAHASKQMIDDLIINLKRLKIKKFGIYLKGATRWKKAALRRFFWKIHKLNMSVIFVKDLTGVPHNGCPVEKKRRKKRRRHKKFRKIERKLKTIKWYRENPFKRWKIIRRGRRRKKKVNRLINYYFRNKAYLRYYYNNFGLDASLAKKVNSYLQQNFCDTEED